MAIGRWRKIATAAAAAGAAPAGGWRALCKSFEERLMAIGRWR